MDRSRKNGRSKINKSDENKTTIPYLKNYYTRKNYSPRICQAHSTIISGYNAYRNLTGCPVQEHTAT